MTIQACDNYSRPAGVMGGPCLHCGRSQPEHVHRKPERMLISGAPVPEDRSHTEINPATGMQRDYIVLSDAERAKGFVKPVRRKYIHAYPSEINRQIGCGGETTMGTALAETYARNPRFYNGTFCVHCKTHFPLNQFIWDGGGALNGEPMDPDLQEAWLIENTAKLTREAEERRQHRIAVLRRELAALEAQG